MVISIALISSLALIAPTGAAHLLCLSLLPWCAPISALNRPLASLALAAPSQSEVFAKNTLWDCIEHIEDGIVRVERSLSAGQSLVRGQMCVFAPTDSQRSLAPLPAQHIHHRAFVVVRHSRRVVCSAHVCTCHASSPVITACTTWQPAQPHEAQPTVSVARAL